ncbi:rod-determining factor RdfA [Salinigranum sp. GCM10025319]|uniref:rod-determining factor RdfA n=1 Tax=Salinigranum sp. GCM10025319 TaxID=3252687 RepID=UPI0036079C98
MAPDANDTGSDGTVNSKVARLIGVYDLGAELGDRLEALWTATESERESLRTLADRFNKRLLETAMNDAGMSVVDGEVDNLYRLLNADDVSSGNRTEARRRLERNGVDVDQLEQDFVTYQAVRSYLKDVRGAAYERKQDGNRVENVAETIQRLKSRTQSVAEKNIDQLVKSEQVSIGEYQLFIDVSILCEECNTQYGLVEFLENGRCDCHTE